MREWGIGRGEGLVFILNLLLYIGAAKQSTTEKQKI